LILLSKQYCRVGDRVVWPIKSGRISGGPFGAFAAFRRLSVWSLFQMGGW
jgi:hypothetical protein